MSKYRKYKPFYLVCILAVVLCMAVNIPTRHSSEKCWEVPRHPDIRNITIAPVYPALTVTEVKSKGFPFTCYREKTKLCISDEPSKKPELSKSNPFLFIINLSIFLGICVLVNSLLLSRKPRRDINLPAKNNETK